jgi:hypothetical protein
MFFVFSVFSSTRKTRFTEVPFPHIWQGSFSAIRTALTGLVEAFLPGFLIPLFTGNVTPDKSTT